MSKLIIETEMPQQCVDCCVRLKCDRYMNALRKSDEECDAAAIKPQIGSKECLIIGELQEVHGDLIDKDALIVDINKQIRMIDAFGIEDMSLIGKVLQQGMIAEINKQEPVIAAERKADEQG